MHPAQGAFLLVEGNVGLRDDRLQPMVLELPLAERSRKKSAAVLTALDVDREGALELGFGENHIDP